jgi:putative transcriptional regulator
MSRTMDEAASRRIDDELAAADAMIEEELEAAARRDPDNPPMDEAEYRAAMALAAERDIHGVARLRRKLGMAQVQFADRYKIPLQTLRLWEQGAREPDAAARSLLAVIEADPAFAAEAIRRYGRYARAA